MKFSKGDRVFLSKDALSIGYIACRSSYTNMYAGKTGTVVGYSGTGKVAVEFDDIVFNNHSYMKSDHDNGCHGKGKLHYSWYISEECLVPCNEITVQVFINIEVEIEEQMNELLLL